MQDQNRKSFKMAAAGKEGPRRSSPRPPVRRPSSIGSRPKESFSRPTSVRKEVGTPQQTPNIQGIRESQTGYGAPGRQTPFYRRRGSIISAVIFVVLCLVCLGVIAVIWVLPKLGF